MPDLRFVRPKKVSSTTEQPYITFETTQIYLPDDFTTADVEYVEHVDEVASVETEDDNARKTRYTDYNPYAYSNGDGSEIASPGSENIHTDSHHSARRNKFRTSKPKSAKHRPSSIRRRPNNQQKREIGTKINDIVYVQSADIISQLHNNKYSMAYNQTAAMPIRQDDSLRNGDIYDKELQLKKGHSQNDNIKTADNLTMATVVFEGKDNRRDREKIALQHAHDLDNGTKQADGDESVEAEDAVGSSNGGDDIAVADNDENVRVLTDTENAAALETNYAPANMMRRVKRKSGKAVIFKLYIIF